MTSGGLFDEGNSIVDCVFKNSATNDNIESHGVDAGFFGQGFANVDFTRCIFSNTTIGFYTWNRNALDGWLTDCYFVSNTVGIYVKQGSAHAYHSAFVNNWSRDFILDEPTEFLSLVSNTSFHAGAFLEEFYRGPNLTPTLIKGNTIIDPVINAINIAEPGPTFMIDNVIACTNDPPTFFGNNATNELVAIGNTNVASSPFVFAGESVIFSNVVDNYVVARSALSLSEPAAPIPATNLNRVIVEVASNATASQLQTAITSASDGSVIHIPWTSNGDGALYLDQTITMPTNKDVRIVGDGYNTIIAWSGAANSTIFAAPHPSHATFSHVRINGTGGGGYSSPVVVSGVGDTQARVHLHDIRLDYGIGANLQVGDCPNTVIDFHGITSDYTGNVDPPATNGNKVLMEGRGKVKFINVDGSKHKIGFVCTNGGSLYVETHYNEVTDTFSNKILLVSGTSTVSLICGRLGENLQDSDYNFNRATTNGYAVTNFSGTLMLGLQNKINDWVNVSGSTTGGIWICGCETVSNAFNHWPITNMTADIPVQTMNWNYDPTPNIGWKAYNDIGTADAAFTRKMLAQARAEYSDLSPMQRRTNQTDVLLEYLHITLGKPNVGVFP
ncbi:MAG TPA: hypothetical protein VL171_18890 [Verrucomicrobiae bacterium]|nr:hypothetical protein [Verrucomicrobiae bacterium]